MLSLRALVLVGGVVAGANAFAHHGIANFDFNKDVAITGTVAKLTFVNPHSWLYVSVPGPTARRPSGAARCARRRFCAARVGASRCSRRDRK